MTTTTLPAPARTRTGGAVAAAGRLTAMLILPPVVLLRLGVRPPTSLPDFPALAQAMRSVELDPLTTAHAVGTTAWLAWTWLAACVALELLAALTHLRLPRLPASGIVRPLVLTITLAAGTARTAGAATLPPPRMPVAAAVPLADPVVDPLALSAGSRPMVAVKPGDTLWGLAESHLGDGHRWKEIFDLNRGLIEPDGRRLIRADVLRPGWTLRLPAAPHVDSERSSAAAACALPPASDAPPAVDVGHPLGEAAMFLTPPSSAERLGEASLVLGQPVALDRGDWADWRDTASSLFGGTGGAFLAVAITRSLNRRRRLQAADVPPGTPLPVTDDLHVRTTELIARRTAREAAATPCAAAAAANSPTVPIGTDAQDEPVALRLTGVISLTGSAAETLLRTLAVQLDSHDDIALIAVGPTLAFVDGGTTRWHESVPDALDDLEIGTADPVVVLTDKTPDHRDLDRLAALGATVIAPGLAEAPTSVEATPESATIRTSEGATTFTPALLDPLILADLEELLAVATQGSEPAICPPPADLTTDEGVVVHVWGEPFITGSAIPIVQPKTIELITYLALHPGGVSASRLKHALWPDGLDNDHAFHQAVSQARKQLGRDASGDELLPAARNGMYRVRGSVRTDLHSRALVRASDPFDGPAHCYEWATIEGFTATVAAASTAITPS